MTTMTTETTTKRRMSFGKLAPDLAADLVRNFRKPVPLVRSAGSPAVGWLCSLALIANELVGDIEGAALPRGFNFDMSITDAAVHPETAQPIGSVLQQVLLLTPERKAPQQRASAPVLAGPRVFASAVALAPSRPVQAPAPSIWPSFYTAEEIAAHEADLAAEEAADRTELTRLNHQRSEPLMTAPQNYERSPAQAKLKLSRANAPSAGRITPAMPLAGTVTDVKSARVFLSSALPGWSSMSNDDQQRAAVLLRDVVKGPSAAQLSRASSDPRPAVLLSLFPGNTKTARARAYLAATVPRFNALDYEQQVTQARALDSTHNLLELEAVPA